MRVSLGWILATVLFAGFVLGVLADRAWLEMLRSW